MVLTILTIAALSVTGLAGTPTAASAALNTAAIEGQVLGHLDPLGYATVTVFNADTGAAVRSAQADSAGRYRVGAIPPGRVKVRATLPGWLDAWANHKASKATADVYTLVAGQTLRQSWNPEVLYLDLTEESVVAGSVLGINDEPNGWDDPLDGVRVTVLSVATGASLGSAVTDRSGLFRIGRLPEGQVKVRATKAGWLTTWALGKATQATADVYTTRHDTPVDVGTMVLYAEAVIQGQVLSSMDPVDGEVLVTVFDADTGRVLQSARSDTYGNYRVGMLPAGRVKVRASRPGYITNWADSFGPRNWETATVFALHAGQVLAQTWVPQASLYLDIPREAVVEGQVVSGTTPVSGATVTVFNADTGAAVRSERTDAAGRYRIDRINATFPLNIKVRATKDGYAPSWADGKTSKATADVFELYPGVTLSQTWDPRVLYLNLRPLTARVGSGP